MTWKAEITKAENGYILSTSNFEEAPQVFEETERGDIRKAEVAAFVNLVYALAEFFDVAYNKHAPYNFDIKIKRKKCN